MPGAIASGSAFILPAALAVAVLAWAYFQWGTTPRADDLFAGIRPAVVVLVALAAWRLRGPAARNPLSMVLAASAFAIALLAPRWEVIALLGAGVVALLASEHGPRRRLQRAVVALPAPLLPLALPALAVTLPEVVPIALIHLKAGALLFGGGYVIIPLLQPDAVARGWLTESQFLDAIAIGQATPGPIVTTATFVGYAAGGWWGALIATVAIFAPAFVFANLARTAARPALRVRGAARLPRRRRRGGLRRDRRGRRRAAREPRRQPAERRCARRERCRAAALAAALVRLAGPLRSGRPALPRDRATGMRSAVVEVTESARLYGETHILWLTMPEEFRHATPGQFVMAYIGDYDDPLLGRACSFHRLREGRRGPEFALLFDVVGRGTDWLARRAPGDAVRVVGPLGRGYEPRERVDHMLLVGGGIGCAPLVWLADELVEQGREVTLVLGAAGEAGIFPPRLLPEAVEVVVATEDGIAGRARPRDRALRAAAALGRSGLRLRPEPDVRGDVRGAHTLRAAQARAGPAGGGDGLRDGHLLRLRRLPQARRRPTVLHGRPDVRSARPLLMRGG